MQSGIYWSSTTDADDTDDTDYAWVVDMYYGHVAYDDKSGGGYFDDYVWPVRAGQCGLLGDLDRDGIYDDGDNSSIVGDNPCTGGQTQNCDDNCINDPNPDQADTDGDGIGDACEAPANLCKADISGPPPGSADGKVDSWDLLQMKREFGRSDCLP